MSRTTFLQAGAVVLVLHAASPALADGCPTSWSTVSLVAKKGPMKARVELTASTAGTSELVACPEGDGRIPRGECVIVLEAITDAPFSAPVRSRTWLDPDGGILQVEVWDGKVHRRSRECVSGRHGWRWERKGKAERLVRERHRASVAERGGLPVVDATSLVWLASARHLEIEGSSLLAAAWAREGLLAIRLQAMERGIVPRRDGGEGVPARRVEIAVEEDDDQQEDESSAAPFGMKGAVSLWLAEDSGLPLVLEGRSTKVGMIRAVNVHAGVR